MQCISDVLCFSHMVGYLQLHSPALEEEEESHYSTPVILDPPHLGMWSCFHTQALKREEKIAVCQLPPANTQVVSKVHKFTILK